MDGITVEEVPIIYRHKYASKSYEICLLSELVCYSAAFFLFLFSLFNYFLVLSNLALE